MNYFMGEILEGRITGVEKAQINRLKLFIKNNEPARCVYNTWNRYTYNNAKKFGIQNYVFTMYDYFQESFDYVNENQFDWLNYWESECNYTLHFIENSNDLRVFHNDKYIMYVHFNDDKYRNLIYINYFDSNKRKIKRELYDTRGFLNCTCILDVNQKVVMENYHAPNGIIKIQKFYDTNSESNELSKIIVKTEDKDLLFSNENELKKFFFKDLYEKGDIYYIDRPHEHGGIVNEMNAKMPFVAILHSTHSYQGKVKSIYTNVLNYIDNYEAIIVSTAKQKKDISQLLNYQIPVYNISVGYIDMTYANIDNKNFQNKKLISISRLVPDKQVEHQIRIISEVKKAIPNVTLDIYGHGGQINDLNEIIQKYKLENNVTLHGFSNDVERQLESANLKVFTSKKEGFALAILESLAKGTPVICYDVDYGPSEMIENGVNGYLIESGNETMMAQTIIKILQDEELLKTLSENSIKSTEKYLGHSIFFKWEQLINTIN
ncbi:serine-aspartate repeat adhesin O-glycosyltransferase SdgA [Staphylococcus petrasii]|uniref:serine-aspartate repeat adhesin O-glycosyltransferase SdgA n=1 Tax=Staphylococcus petrasii TaxID=1276936 RepID=UPI001F5ABED5|nr:glycosyltransferase [Staphylococcus petrasii]MCI2773818.1 glycosyltransferase [Staphylococcus petrasii]